MYKLWRVGVCTSLPAARVVSQIGCLFIVSKKVQHGKRRAENLFTAGASGWLLLSSPIQKDLWSETDPDYINI